MFTKVMLDKGDKELNLLFVRLSALLSIVMLVLSGITFIFADQIAQSIVSGGFLAQALSIPSKFSFSDGVLLAQLLRIMLLSPIFLGVSAVMAGYLQVYKRFIVTAMAPLLYNFGMIVGSLIFVKYLHMGVTGAAIAVIIGSFLHLVTQVPSYIKVSGAMFKDWRETFKFSRSHEIVDIIKLSIPRALAVLGEQINVIVNTLISFTVAKGALSAYRYSFSLYLFPAQIVSGAIAMAAMTRMSEFFHRKLFDDFRDTFNKTIQQSVFIIVFCIAVVVVLRLPIVRLVYGSLNFDWRATVLTSWSLVLLSFAMLAYVVMAIVLRAFYSIHETRLPLVITALSIVVNLAATILFTNFFSHYLDWRGIFQQVTGQISSTGLTQALPNLGSDLIRWFTTRSDFDFAVGGIALGFTFSYLFEMTLGLILLNTKIKVVSWHETIRPIVIKLFIAVLTCIPMYAFYYFLDAHLDTSRTISIFIIFVAVSLFGGIVYLLLSKIFKVKELDFVTQKVKVLLRRGQ
jgi:putative peptidoglycan lipid II flippase